MKVAVKAARANPDKFELEVNDDEVGRLEECLEDIDGRLFRTGMFAVSLYFPAQVEGWDDKTFLSF